MLSDCIAQRWGCLFGSLIAEILGKTNYPSWNTLMSTFEWGDELIQIFGNEGYRTVKMWEALSIGNILISGADDHVDGTIFLREMEKEFLTSLPLTDHIHPDFLKLKLMEANALLFNPDNLTITSQLFGLYRIWGHPSVDVEAGIKKVRNIACRPGIFDYLAIQGMLIQWRETFCVNYYEKNKKWPKFQFTTKHEGSYLHHALDRGTPISLISPDYNPDHWLNIKFDQTFHIQDKYELSEMLSDKATSSTREELIWNIINRGGIGTAVDRSVIVQWLKENYQNPQEFLKDINDNGFGDGKDVIGVHEKKREMSIEPRFFALLTIRKRLYVVLTEALIADHILPYFPEITMTFDAVTLRKKIQENTRKLVDARLDSKTLITNLHFSKWNSNMRKEETYNLFEDMDHLFGLKNCIARTHDMFTLSTIY